MTPTRSPLAPRTTPTRWPGAEPFTPPVGEGGPERRPGAHGYRQLRLGSEVRAGRTRRKSGELLNHHTSVAVVIFRRYNKSRGSPHRHYSIAAHRL